MGPKDQENVAPWRLVPVHILLLTYMAMAL